MPLQRACPRCDVLEAKRRPRLPADTERVYVLVPGILGYGWEWNGVQIALGTLPRSAIVVADWEPWRSLGEGGEAVRAALQRLLRSLPPRAREVVVLGHSMGGLVSALAAAELRVPQGVRVRVLTIGAPFAGMRRTLVEYEGSLRSPTPLAVGGIFRRAHWGRPAPGVTLEVYPTTWPNDPVMKPSMGHDPGNPGALPAGAVLRALPTGIDHNLAVVWLAERLAAEARAALPSTP